MVDEYITIKGKKYSKEWLKKRYDETGSTRIIAREIGCDPTCVSKGFKKLNLEFKCNKKINWERFDELYYKNNLSGVEVAKILGVGYDRLRNEMDKTCREIRPNEEFNPPIEEFMAVMYGTYPTTRDTCKYFNISTKTLQKYMDKHNLKLLDRKRSYHPIIEKYLNEAYTHEPTKENTGDALKSFFDITEINPDTFFDDNKTNNDYVDEIKLFILKSIDKTPRRRRQIISMIKLFLHEYGKIIPDAEIKKLKRKIKGSKKPITLDRIPTNQEMKQILDNADIMDKTAFLIQSSSGMRISEVALLEITDIDLNSKPVIFYLRAETTKTKTPRPAFISTEAEEQLKKWLKCRDEYLLHTSKRKISDKRLFPFKRRAIRDRWNELLKKSNFDMRDPNTNFHILHDHTLRKYFRTNMATELPMDMVYTLYGEEGYLDSSYRRYTLKDRKEAYLKAEYTLWIYKSTDNFKKDTIEDRVNRMEDKIDKILEFISNET